MRARTIAGRIRVRANDNGTQSDDATPNVRRPRVAGLAGRSAPTDPSAAANAASTTTQAAPESPSEQETLASQAIEPAAREPSESETVTAQGIKAPAVADPDESATPSEDTSRKWFSGRHGMIRAALVLVTVLGAVVAVLAGVSAHQLRTSDSAGNSALADADTTKTVVRQVGDAITSAFSYDYADTAKTEQAAQQALTGRAVDEYSKLYGQVKQLAPAQKAVLTTTIRSVGVTELRGDQATALVLVDQQAIRGDNNQRQSGAAQLSVHAQRFGAIWKITDITVL